MNIRSPQEFDAVFSTPDGDIKKHFKWQMPSPGGTREGAVYADENNVLWYLKLEEPVYSVKEVLASQIYHSIDHHAPQVQLVKCKNAWLVASEWREDLANFKFDHRMPGLERMLIASFIIGDGDVIKNTKCSGEKIFRYDFGAGLGMTKEKQEQMKDLSSLYQIVQPISSLPIDLMSHLDMSKFSSMIKNIKYPDVEWDWWIKSFHEAFRISHLLPSEMDEEQYLENQRQYVNQNIEILLNLDKKVDLEEMNQNAFKLNSLFGKAIIHFYQTIEPSVHSLIPDYAMTMALKHFCHFQKTGQHPVSYQSLIERAAYEIKMFNFYQEIGIKNTLDNETIFSDAVMNASAMISAAETQSLSAVTFLDKQKPTAAVVNSLPQADIRTCSPNV